MGQAKKRGTLEERKAESIAKKHQEWIDGEPRRQAVRAAQMRRGKSLAPIAIALSIGLINQPKVRE